MLCEREQDCNSCEYKHMPCDGGHCYMFKDKPEGLCAQFSLISTGLQQKVKKILDRNTAGWSKFI